MSDSEIKFDFMRQRRLAAVFSILMVLASIAALATKGLNLGLDFLGGTQLEVTYNQSADLEAARAVLESAGFEDVSAVYFGNETEVMIRFHGSLEDAEVRSLNQSLAAEVSGAEIKEVGKRNADYEAKLVFADAESVLPVVENVFDTNVYGRVRTEVERTGDLNVYTRVGLADVALNKIVANLSAAAGSQVSLNYSESVDSAVGEEMLISAMEGLLVALVMVMLYVAVRFQYKFGLGAVAALVHDVLITLGLFAMFQWDFDLTVFAAVLAVIGYSLNDTIVVFDRIRENFRKVRDGGPVDTINLSLNQTLGRTLATSFTTLLVLLALFFFGGEVIHGFSQALIVGIVIGTYSSIYVAANITLFFNVNKEDLAVPVKEGAEFEEIL